MSTYVSTTPQPVHMNHPAENVALNKANLQDLPPDEQDVLQKLRENYTDTAKVEIELHRAIFGIEHASDDKYLEAFAKRRVILDQFRKPEQHESALRGFWLRVLKAAGTEFHDPEDENIMLHLIDIRSRMYVQPNVRMIIEFEFEKNEYFSNTLLTKTYYIKCRAEPNDAVIYDGIEITNMEGTKIDWLKPRRQTNLEYENLRTFFEYFNDRVESEYANRGVLDEEIAFGFFLREKVIPKAIYFFTGELAAEKEDSEDENESDIGDRSSEADGNIDEKEEEDNTENNHLIEHDNERGSLIS